MDNTQDSTAASGTEWTFPTRTCRICFEAVVPTVTMYPPGLPASFQHPVVEYKNEDEYGRLLKPCLCKGSQRYIHEHCLKQQRTLGSRPNSLWKCPTCGYQFNFQRLTTQKLLSSRGSTVFFTVVFLIVMIFMLGFIADPIINLYVDPYDTLTTNDYWHPIEVNDFDDNGTMSAWALHFVKGFISMGVVGFLKTLALNPWNWWNWRNTGMVGGRSRTAATGQDRVVNISWIAVVIGICSAFYLFYTWVKSIIAASLQHIGNHIVDTQLPDDDEDIKPPEGWKPPRSSTTTSVNQSPPTPDANTTEGKSEEITNTHFSPSSSTVPRLFDAAQVDDSPLVPSPHSPMLGSFNGTEEHDVGLGAVHRQGWSFGTL